MNWINLNGLDVLCIVNQGQSELKTEFFKKKTKSYIGPRILRTVT